MAIWPRRGVSPQATLVGSGFSGHQAKLGSEGWASPAGRWGQGSPWEKPTEGALYLPGLLQGPCGHRTETVGHDPDSPMQAGPLR